jgi:hypothetical protein
MTGDEMTGNEMTGDEMTGDERKEEKVKWHHTWIQGPSTRAYDFVSDSVSDLLVNQMAIQLSLSFCVCSTVLGVEI